MRQYLDFLRTSVSTALRRTIGRHRHGERVWLPNALRSERRLSAVTTKKLHLRSIIYELLWFLRGDTNVKYLHEHGVSIWDEWADEKGELVCLRQAMAQLAHAGRAANRPAGAGARTAQEQSQFAPHPVSAWNVGELDRMALLPCHALFQFYVADGRLSCQLYQRSPMPCWRPLQYASYALLTHMIASNAISKSATSCGRAEIAICT